MSGKKTAGYPANSVSGATLVKNSSDHKTRTIKGIFRAMELESKQLAFLSELLATGTTKYNIFFNKNFSHRFSSRNDILF